MNGNAGTHYECGGQGCSTCPEARRPYWPTLDEDSIRDADEVERVSGQGNDDQARHRRGASERRTTMRRAISASVLALALAACSSAGAYSVTTTPAQGDPSDIAYLGSTGCATLIVQRGENVETWTKK